MDRNENTAMPAVLKVPQLTHRTSCDVIVSGLVADTSGEGRQRIELMLDKSYCKLHIYNKIYCSARLIITHYLMH